MRFIIWDKEKINSTLPKYESPVNKRKSLFESTVALQLAILSEYFRLAVKQYNIMIGVTKQNGKINHLNQ